MINIISYKHISGVEFGSKESDVLKGFGQPLSRSLSSDREKEFNYSDFVLRFDAATEELRECTLLPGCRGTLNGHAFDWSDDVLHWLSGQDRDLVEVFGFVLSLRLGVALSGFHDGDESQKAIHAFREGDWDSFRARMKPYVHKPR